MHNNYHSRGRIESTYYNDQSDRFKNKRNQKNISKKQAMQITKEKKGSQL